MAKTKLIGDDENGGKAWREGDLITTFALKRIKEYMTPLMKEWLDAPLPTLDAYEQLHFDKTIKKAIKGIEGWSEEELKMKFITHILDLGYLNDEEPYIGYFDKIISATVDSIKLTVKADFMLAKGVLDAFTTPYFHFQEFKPYKNPKGDSMAQLLQAMMIGQVKNQNDKPMYGIEIIGDQWIFVIMEGKSYCISKKFNSTEHQELLQIIAILRKFRTILRERLID